MPLSLSSDLISQFVKVTKDTTTEKTEKTMYGTIVEYDGGKYVRLDGSEFLTPIDSTTNAENEDRVTVTIKDHNAIVTGNVTSPSPTTSELQGVDKKADEIGSKISDFEIVIADKVDTKELNAANARIDELQTDNVTIKKTLNANAASIKQLEADNVTINGTLDAHEGYIGELTATDVEITGRLNTADANIGSLQADNVVIRNELDAQKANIDSVVADNVTIKDQLTAQNADIADLETKKLSAESADLKYANIDFSNIGKAAMEYFYANSGLIRDVVINNGSITGNLVGVTIKGDIIEGGTVIADKLVIQGEDGLYYKLNTNGVTTSTEQTEYNSLNGSIITANTITAEKINVSDLVAFDATIGGFHITEHSIYSEVKSSADNTTRGIYMDDEGQMSFGDAVNYVRFFKAEDGAYTLAISASTITLGTEAKNVENEINDAKDTATSNADRIGEARLDIDSINETLSSLVRGENGESLMTQTDTGWTFNIAAIQSALDSATADIGGISSNLEHINSAISVLNNSVDDLGEYTDYIQFGIDNGKPCIILGEVDSSFKVLITNTDIRFVEGTSVPAYISNQSLHVEKAVISSELRQGGFTWVARENGNYGLLWKGE